jgi:hypothetical protein
MQYPRRIVLLTLGIAGFVSLGHTSLADASRLFSMFPGWYVMSPPSPEEVARLRLQAPIVAYRVGTEQSTDVVSVVRCAPAGTDTASAT